MTEVDPTRRRDSSGLPGGLVLVVDENAPTRALAMYALSLGDLHAVGAATIDDALDCVLDAPELIEAILLAVFTPGTAWTELLRRLKGSPSTERIPVILVTVGTTSDEDIVRGVELGACDLISVPCSPIVLVAKIRAVRHRAMMERTLRDELRAMSLQAMSDPLTGLLNRRNFESRIAEATAHARRLSQPFAIVMLDLDHFKAVNDVHGHVDGDRLLVHFANTIHVVMRADDVAFRFGGDEFALLLSACDARRALEVTERLRDWLCASPFRFSDGTDQVVAFSAGVAAAAEDERYSGERLVDRADLALYRAKARGSDRVEC